MNTLHVLPTTGKELASAVMEKEYKRLLQIPRSRPLEGDLLDLASKSREWYARHGRPFLASTRLRLKNVVPPIVQLENDVELTSISLAERLESGEAHALVVLAASAGPEVADHIAEHWAEEKPDEAFFLDRFAAAVTEHLIQWASAYICRLSESSSETLLPHLSPGCGNWDLSDQHRLMTLLSNEPKIGPIKLFDTGALYPQHSVLAAMGVTHRKFDASEKDICRTCDLNPCAFRRAPYELL